MRIARQIQSLFYLVQLLLYLLGVDPQSKNPILYHKVIQSFIGDINDKDLQQKVA